MQQKTTFLESFVEYLIGRSVFVQRRQDLKRSGNCFKLYNGCMMKYIYHNGIVVHACILISLQNQKISL